MVTAAVHGAVVTEVAKSVPVAAGAALPGVTSMVTIGVVAEMPWTTPPVMPVPVTG